MSPSVIMSSGSTPDRDRSKAAPRPGCTCTQLSRPIDDRLSTDYCLGCRQEVSVVPSDSSGGRSPMPDEPAVRGSSSLGDRVYRTLRDEIVFLDLPPGAPVREVDVATRLGVGRTPVREALQRLAMNYLVEIMPGRGAFVAPISLPDLVKISEIRVNLEGFAAASAATRATDAERAVLRDLRGQIRQVTPDTPRARL